MQMRPMTAADIPDGLRLCRASGWNQLESDWRMFLECNPAGCRVAVRDRNVVGTVTTLKYEEKFGWISMLLVDPDWRGRGIGTRLLQESVDLLAPAGTARLDATPAGKVVYDKMGFQEEYRLMRMRAASPVRDRSAGVTTRVRAIAAGDWARLLDWDRRVFGADRSAILRRVHASAPEYALMAESAGEIKGYLFGRHGFRSEHLGPLVAIDEPTARGLVLTCLSRYADKSWLTDAPQHSPEWRAWLESLGFVAERPFIRMFRGANSYPGLPHQVFAIAGPELG